MSKPSFRLLTRDAFREGVFQRDGHTCVVCQATGVVLDAHHIFERRLWSDGGYYLENGVSLCDGCHRRAESTHISVETLHELIGAKLHPVPESFAPDGVYDKWGNPILENGRRARGPLFDSHREALRDHLHLFDEKVKYPRTMHLPWSPGATADDRMWSEETVRALGATEVVITEKMDGENTTLYRDGIHARSISAYRPHWSRGLMKTLHAKIAHDIPKGWRICGENLHGLHSVEYQHLLDFFQVFSVWDASNRCLSWDETLEWCALLDLTPVPELFRGPWDDLFRLNRPVLVPKQGEPWRVPKSDHVSEGYVVRPAGSFHLLHFQRVVAKYVRANHVQSPQHWFSGSAPRFNALKSPSRR